MWPRESPTISRSRALKLSVSVAVAASSAPALALSALLNEDDVEYEEDALRWSKMPDRPSAVEALAPVLLLPLPRSRPPPPPPPRASSCALTASAAAFSVAAASARDAIMALVAATAAGTGTSTGGSARHWRPMAVRPASTRTAGRRKRAVARSGACRAACHGGRSTAATHMQLAASGSIHPPVSAYCVVEPPEDDDEATKVCE